MRRLPTESWTATERRAEQARRVSMGVSAAEFTLAMKRSQIALAKLGDRSPVKPCLENVPVPLWRVVGCVLLIEALVCLAILGLYIAPGIGA